MIISASRRTDIPAFYSDWFFRRLRDGWVLVRNPINPHSISRVSLSPDVVDGIVFWTKNPLPMIGRLDKLGSIPYYFQFTLNPYGTDVEPNVPSKSKVLIPVFQRLAKRIGPERIVWRYDPILFNEKYTVEYHLKYFEYMARLLAGYTSLCTVSFLDFYKKAQHGIKLLGIRWPALEQEMELIRCFSQIAGKYGMALSICAEGFDAESCGAHPASCIDKSRLEHIGGYRLAVGKDKNQRPKCGCAASMDIGAYNTCRHGCRYCYANFSIGGIMNNCQNFRPDSPLLCGEIQEGDRIHERSVRSYRKMQTSFWDS